MKPQSIIILITLTLFHAFVWQEAAAQRDSVPNFKKVNKGWHEINKDSKGDPTNFLKNHKNELGLQKDDELRLKKTEADDLGFTHYRYQHFYKGIKVEGSEYILHSKGNTLVSGNGKLLEEINLSVSPVLNEENALEFALKKVPAKVYSWASKTDASYPKGELVIVKQPTASSPNEYVLTYRFEINSIDPWQQQVVFVNAATGEISLSYSLIDHCIPSAGDSYFNGTVSFLTRPRAFDFALDDLCRQLSTWRYDKLPFEKFNYFVSIDNQWNANTSMEGVSGHWAVTKSYDYFDDVHGRTGTGGGPLEVIFLRGSGLDHFGGNTGPTYNPSHSHESDPTQAIILPTCSTCPHNTFAALDVIGHEYTHGVNRFSAQLSGQGEPGALNESFADIFGSVIQYYVEGFNMYDTYTVGEELVDAKYLRSLSDPHLYSPNGSAFPGQPKYYLEPGYWDPNGEKHHNNGVQNHWFYLLANGGTLYRDGTGYSVTGIGIENAAAIAFRNLTVYLTSTSDFSDAKNGSILAAMDLFGPCHPYVESVVDAWRAVKVSSLYGDYHNHIVDCNTITAVHNNNQAYLGNALNSVLSMCPIQDNKVTTFVAGQYIDLWDGFNSGTGASTNFQAYINPCYPSNIYRKSIASYAGAGKDDVSTTNPDGQENGFSTFAYPNPSTGNLLLKLPASDVAYSVSVLNPLGEKLKEFSIAGSADQIDLSELEDGIYFLKASSGETIKTQKVILAK